MKISKVVAVAAIIAIVVLVLFNLHDNNKVNATSQYLDATILAGNEKPITVKIKPESTSVGDFEAYIINNDLSQGPSFVFNSPGYIQHGPEWIDSQTLLLNINTIYSPVTKLEKKIELPTQVPFGYGLSPDRKQLAVIGKSEDGNAMEAWILDLKTNQSLTIANFPFKGPVREVFADIKWLNNKEIIMDGDISGKPALYKYDITNKSLSIFKENAMFPQISPDGQLIAARQTNDYILKNSTLSTNSILIDTKGETQFELPSNYTTIVWNSNKGHTSFLGVEPGKITKYSIVQSELKQDKSQYIDGLIMFPSLSPDDVSRYIKFNVNGTKIDKVSQNILQ